MATAVQAKVEGTWTKWNDQWCVRVPSSPTPEWTACSCGCGLNEVEAVSKDGKVKDVLVSAVPVRNFPASQFGPANSIYAVQQHAQAPATLVEPGFFRTDAGIFRVVPSRTTYSYHRERKVYAKRLAFGDGMKGASWEFAPGVVYRLTEDDRMTLEEAKDFGRSHGFCVACGALLTDPESIAAGIGPVCATRF